MFAGWHILLPLLWLTLTGAWVAALVDALRRPDAEWKAARQSKVLFVVLIVVLGWLGALLYAVIPRPQLKRGAMTGVAA